MEQEPHRDLRHREARRSRGDRLAFERDRAHDLALTGAEPVDELPRVAQRMRILRLRRGQELLEILERLGPLPSASAQGVDDLVPGYGVGPGRERLTGVPGMPLKVDRQQSLLHRVLDIRFPHSRARTPPAPSGATSGRYPPEAAGMRPHRPRSRPSSFETTDRPDDPRWVGLSYGLRFVLSAVTGPEKYFGSK